MNHRIFRLVFAFAVGLLAAYFAFSWISNPAPRIERQVEESVVLASRHRLQEVLGSADIEIVDPLLVNRAIGKAYVYRSDDGWEVSGFYKRNDGERWHPYLMSLSEELTLAHLKVQDSSLTEQARTDSLLEIVP